MIKCKFIQYSLKRLSYGRKLPVLPPFNFTPPEYNGPSYSEVKELRGKYLNPGIFSYYKTPIMITEGKMQYLYDEKGKRYLDFFAGVVAVSVGHCHPRIVNVAQEQISKLMHTSTIYLDNNTVEFCRDLASRMPNNLKSIYLVNSGSEANELAMLMARLHTNNNTIISLRNGNHGMGGASMEMTNLGNWKFNIPSKQGVEKALCPDLYRGDFCDKNRTEEEIVEKYVNEVLNVINYNTSGNIAAFYSEPIQGAGGTVPMPPSYLKRVYEIVRKHGGLCISDEIQTGFGRLGKEYWGCTFNNAQPDIITMAKGIGNGIPLAAVATKPEIAETMKRKLSFYTFGGNPISTVIGKEVLKIIQEEKLQENCLQMGGLIKTRLSLLKNKYNIIGDVRGEGLMIGLELVKNRETKEPNLIATNNIFERCKDLGLLMGKGGMFGNVFRIKPPMCINKNDVEYAIDVLDFALEEESKGSLSFFK